MTEPPLNNISQFLYRRADTHPRQSAIIAPVGSRFETISYEELRDYTEGYMRSLLSEGVGVGTRVVLMVRPSLEFFALTLALMRLRAVTIFIDPGLGIRNIASCMAKAKPQVFIGIPMAQIARLIFGWERGSWSKIICTKSIPGLGVPICRRRVGGGLDEIDDAQVKDQAAIVFTSGSTGPPKGVSYTHKNFLAQIEFQKRAFGIEEGEVDLSTFPLFGLYAAGLGMTAVIPRMDFSRPGKVSPRNVIEPALEFHATQLFGSPALLKKLLTSDTVRNLRNSALRRVVSAGAPVPWQLIKRLRDCLPGNSRILTPYGATECLPISVIDSSEILDDTSVLTRQGRGVCVGRPIPGIQVDVIEISDEPIAHWSEVRILRAGEVGELVVRGPQVTESYFSDQKATKLAKIAGCDGEPHHRMGDLGYLDDMGRIWFCGRKSHRVEADGKTLFSVAAEGIINHHQRVERSALVGVRREGRKVPMVCIEPVRDLKRNEKDTLKNEILALSQGHTETAGIRDVYFRKRLPVDIRHNSKIFRERIASWIEKRQ